MAIWPASKGARIAVSVTAAVVLAGIAVLCMFSVFYLFALVGFALIPVGCVALFKNVEARRMAFGASFEGQATTEIPLVKASSKKNMKAKAHGRIESQPVAVILIGIILAAAGIVVGRSDSLPKSPAPVLLQYPATLREAGASAPWKSTPEQEVHATVEHCSADPAQVPVFFCKVWLQNDSQTNFRLLASEFFAVDDLSQSYELVSDANVPPSDWDDPKSSDYPFGPGAHRVVYLSLTGPVTQGAQVLEFRFSLLKQGSNSSAIPCWVDVSVQGAGLSS